MGRFGPQGWWPVTPSGALRARYRPGNYRTPAPRQALEVCLGAILTQNAAWTNASRALEALHEERALEPRRLLAMPLRRLERLVRPSGFYAQKSRKIKTFARHLIGKNVPLERWLGRTPLPALREDLLAIKGVGPETADSIILYAANRPAFVVDAYTRRIGARLGWFPESAGYAEVQSFLTSRLPRSVRLYNEFHALFVAQAKQYCRKRPRCAGCVLLRACRAGREEK